MYGDKIDVKNTQLGLQLFWLRQYIDLHRITALNQDFLNGRDVGREFWLTTYSLSLDAIAVTICKMFERQTMGYERNSIPGIVDDFVSLQLDRRQKAIIRAYGDKYGIQGEGGQSAFTLRDVVARFMKSHSDAFEVMKYYRDKFASHSEHGVPLRKPNLPSHAEFEEIFDFANGFYRTVHNLSEIGPALMECRTQSALVTILRKLGHHDPVTAFRE